MSNLHPARPKLALIAGPTAGGKSSLALAVAERCRGTIINADSAQVYRDLEIVTARPSPCDEERLPHRLYGYVDGALPSSAASWAADARSAIEEAHKAGRLPILVGGTGLYLRTLLEGIAPIPEIDPAVRAEVRALGVESAHRALQLEDPATAARLRPTDTSRVARALEVVRSTGRSMAEWQKEKIGGIGPSVTLAPLILLPPRPWLYARCDARFERMFTEGREEVARLLARNLSPSLPVMRAIGVSEIAVFLRGELDAETCLAAGKQATRHYAKRQYTWFRHQPPASWPRFERAVDEAGQAEALDAIVASGLLA